MDKDTWSRSMVAMLGLDTIGASRMGGFKSADSATPAPARFKGLVLQLKKDDRLPIIRNFRQGGRGEDGTRRAVTSAASGGACASRLAARGDAVPFSGLDGLRRSFTTRLVKCAHFGGLRLFRSSGWRGYG